MIVFKWIIAPIFSCLIAYLHLRFFINQQISAENSSLAQAELHSQLPVQSRIWFGLLLHSSLCILWVRMCSCPAHLSEGCYFLVLNPLLLAVVFSLSPLPQNHESWGERVWCKYAIGNWQFHSLLLCALALCGSLHKSPCAKTRGFSDEGKRCTNLWILGMSLLLYKTVSI